MIFTNNIYNNNYIEKEFDPVINIKKVLSFEDKRTTIMIKNLPNKFTREKLLDIIDKKFKNTYDIFILPRDSNKNRNFGYAFMNFLSSYYIPHFYYEFNGKSWIDTNSIKVCEITYSKFQGLKELVSHYSNKITFLNNEIIVNSGINNIFIPNEYKLLFKQLFPNQQIEENDIGFITKVSF
jgi:RNA recognition motif-containing protein